MDRLSLGGMVEMIITDKDTKIVKKHIKYLKEHNDTKIANTLNKVLREALTLQYNIDCGIYKT